MQDSGSLAVFKVIARDQGQYKGLSGAFVTNCNISCCLFVLFYFVLFILYIILRICFALRKDIATNFIPKCEASRGLQRCAFTFSKSFEFFVHLGKYDFSFDTEFCLISHKSLHIEQSSPKKYISKFS